MAFRHFGGYLLNLLASASAIIDNKPVPAQVDSFLLEAYQSIHDRQRCVEGIASLEAQYRGPTDRSERVLSAESRIGFLLN